MTDIAQALKFVRGAVAKKDFVPELTFFQIRENRITAFNGTMSLSHPIDLELDIAPKAKLFEKALTSMPDDVPVSLTVTQAGRLSVKAGPFRVLVSCQTGSLEGMFPQPQGERIELDWGILPIFKAMLPFVAEDASRPWARAIKLVGNSAYATNNVVLIERWCRRKEDSRPNPLFPLALAVPVEAVEQIVRMGLEPCAMQLGDTSVTFHFENGAWMRSQLLHDPWPPVEEVVNQPLTDLVSVPENFAENVKRLEGFITDSNTIFVKGSLMSTADTDSEGAHFDLGVALGDGMFHIKVLTKIAAVATKVNLSARPVVFTAPNIRGVAVPMGS